jgi:cytidylate kinase|tara:strand:- start:724 stop:963 length:240 start_codon:yes stop_codon:yes gene_type:complete
MADEQQNQTMQEDQLKQLVTDYKITFGTEQGERVLRDLENRCHMFRTTNVKGDAHESAFMEGQRAAILFIKQMITRELK